MDATPPGLLPENLEPRPSPLRWLPLAIGIAFVAILGLAVHMLLRFREERDRANARVAELAALVRRPAIPSAVPEPTDYAARIRELENRVRLLEARPSPDGSVASRGPDVRVASPPREERTSQFMYVQVPVYLAMSSLRESDYRGAGACLAGAARSDGAWYRKVRPRDFIPNAEEYAKLLAALEAHVQDNPLDVEAKVLLAYFHYHDKGPAHAKLLLVEALNIDPAHPVAKPFLSSLEK